MTMNDEALLRYSRQIMLPDIDIAGQEKLLAASALIVGLGGLGSPAALYMAAAGFGRLVLADFDIVELSNLQRQIAHATDDIGRPKVESARDAILALNPHIDVACINERLDAASISRIITDIDVVLDGCDNFATRFMVNDACVATRTPLVSAAAIQMEGQIMVYDPNVANCPCYRCLYQDANDGQLNCAENGVAAPVVGIMGSLQAMEALKLVVGTGETLAGYLLVFDAKNMEWRKLKLPRNPQCPTCGTGN